jgi:hypothetical protein
MRERDSKRNKLHVILRTLPEKAMFAMHVKQERCRSPVYEIETAQSHSVWLGC